MKRKFLRFIYRMRSGRNRSEDYNVIYGKFFVRYKDGLASRPCCYDVAKDYAEMFGGEVVERF